MTKLLRRTALLVGLLLMLSSDAHRSAAQSAIDGYTNYDALAAQLKALDASDLVTVTSLAKTLGGRDVFLVTIAEGDPTAKPAILILGNVEAAHLVGSELALRIAQRIAGPTADVAAAKKLLSQVTLYIIPRPSPDASERFFARPLYERNGNDRPTDDDRDGQVDEDPPQDLNGDGLITMMRVEDASGSYLPHPADARVMIKADPHKGEQGRYTVYSEGRDDDGDEEWNEDGPGGVALHRNFPPHYAYFEPLSGPHQVSEIETRAVADFAFDYPNIALVFCFSPEDNLCEPWKVASGDAARGKPTLLSPDAEYVNHLADEYRKLLAIKDPPAPAASAGSFVEWAYQHFGRWSMSARGWSIPKVVTKPEPAAAVEPAANAAEGVPEKPETAARKSAKAEDKDKRGAEDLAALAWFKQQGLDGFVDWKVVEHPDFPGKKVEIGGFKPYLRLNPPAAELDPLAEKHQQFLTALADKLPRVQLAATKVEPLGGSVFRVSATIVNTGYLPTMADAGRASREVHPLQVSIELPAGAKLVAGVGRTRLPTLAGSGGKAEHSWLLQVPGNSGGKATIAVGCAPVGRATQVVELK